MRLVLAVSADGFLAKDSTDDMKWTGPLDKAVFRLLTLSDNNPLLLAGRVTYDQMPPLPGRRMVKLSRSPTVTNENDLIISTNLDRAAALWQSKAWLIGGPGVAMEALKKGYVTRAFICESAVKLESGIPFEPLAAILPPQVSSIKVGDVRVRIFSDAA